MSEASRAPYGEGQNSQFSARSDDPATNTGRATTQPCETTKDKVNSASNSAFGPKLKKWRALRHMSQNDLAIAANVSSRHISFLETGRARPSRKMIMRLAEVLDIPLRSRNELLDAAGHRAGFGETPLGDEKLSQVSESLNLLLASHDPFPAFLMDDNWNVVRANKSASRILSILMDGVEPPKGGSSNIVDWLVVPQGLNTVLSNWQEIAMELVRRIHRKGELAGSDPKLHTMLAKLVNALESATEVKRAQNPELFLPIEIRKSGLALNLYSTVTRVADPRDITLQELTLETLCPADRETHQLLVSLSKLSP